ncbi:MATH domain and coiled-coil domain-containing protein At3g58370-like [Vigna unguiculata]|uniref:Ubiquitin carboxyl-terminal hydrolase 7 n=1 Tax=Vigna unguiculata TaxID=3917 RepID=A0A4D6MYV6_VIGUN|nr:MATH domain and coiled-coil domain-containing protein At3g58370-like [Vigna unguiculata]QCE05319.1 ubiquitin carboxyl-terminal hydrolase 7 [Vigna unguiculata]
MENQNTKDKVFEKFTWTIITNFSTLDSKKLYSDTFSLDGHKWRVVIYPKGNKVKCLSIYLNGGGVATMPHGWEKFANFKLILINQFDHKMNVTGETSHTFNSKEVSWGFPSFIPLDELLDSSRGFLLNDSCIIEVHILVQQSEHEKEVDESLKNVDNKLVKGIENVSSKEMISTSSIVEMVDFRGIGKVEKHFVPLLEEVCSLYPSLIHSKQKKSQRFTEWAFTALGRVLHFLNTKKVRNMDDESCNHLQTLWEEVETFGFDLAWLKPHVESALGMKTRVEKVVEVKRLEENVITLKENVESLEENVTTLEEKTKTLRRKIIEAEVNLEMAKRDLEKAKKGSEECDLDVELGYGKSL